MMRVMIPRLRLEFALFLLIFAPIADLLTAIQKAIHRISS